MLTPHLSGLNPAKGGLEASLGWFGAKWEINGAQLRISVQTPEGTNGAVTIPSGTTSVQLNSTDVGIGADRVIRIQRGNHTLVS